MVAWLKTNGQERTQGQRFLDLLAKYVGVLSTKRLINVWGLGDRLGDF
ncbi:MAG: hypothetical protein AB4368_14630 [Xenococcaceae cyanobacterium]